MVDFSNAISTQSLTKGVSQLGFYAEIVVYILLGLLVMMTAIYFLQYRYKVLVFERRGEGNYRIRRDKAKKIMDKGVVKFKLFRLRSIFPPPGDNQTYVDGKSDFFMLFKNENNFVYPIKFANPSGTFKVMDNDVIDFMINEFKKSSELYDKPSFFEKYGHIVIQIVFVGVMFVIFLILLNKMDAVAQALNHLPSSIQVSVAGGGKPPI